MNPENWAVSFYAYGYRNYNVGCLSFLETGSPHQRDPNWRSCLSGTDRGRCNYRAFLPATSLLTAMFYILFYLLSSYSCMLWETVEKEPMELVGETWSDPAIHTLFSLLQKIWQDRQDQLYHYYPIILIVWIPDKMGPLGAKLWGNQNVKQKIKAEQEGMALKTDLHFLVMLFEN